MPIRMVDDPVENAGGKQRIVEAYGRNGADGAYDRCVREVDQLRKTESGSSLYWHTQDLVTSRALPELSLVWMERNFDKLDRDHDQKISQLEFSRFLETDRDPLNRLFAGIFAAKNFNNFYSVGAQNGFYWNVDRTDLKMARKAILSLPKISRLY